MAIAKHEKFMNYTILFLYELFASIKDKQKGKLLNKPNISTFLSDTIYMYTVFSTY